MEGASANKVLTRALRASSGSVLTLSHYPAGARQERHEHDHVQVSFLLAGELMERIGRADHDLATPAVCVKQAGTDHDNLWGRSGTLILSARLPQATLEAAPAAIVDAWSRIDARPIAAIIGAAFAAVGPDEITTVIDDLLALLDPEPASTDPAPDWLRRAREAIAEADGMSANGAANIAGVHRVHLSRSFCRHYGLPLCVYRRRVMLSRAIEAALRSADSLADIATLAGFADQSHMHRAIRQTFGTTPKLLRRQFDRHARHH